MRRGRHLVAAVLAAITVACGPAPDLAPEPTPGVERLACLSVPADQCGRLAAGAAGRLGGEVIVVSTMVGSWCDADPCPPGLPPRTNGNVFLEVDGPLRIVRVDLQAEPTGEVRFAEPVLETSALITPTSPRVGPGPVQFDLGHCGLHSPVDFDGSLWDPIGEIDGDAPDAINAAAGQIVLLGPQRARFRSDGGFTVDLARRDGPKAYPLCA
ncbi:MAG TPA: hypothetical protein VFO05_07775 [Candidatus Limnocylindrales bacterium]|nr:hypothetical protein [Candidatus Limnocylindrales bacterium]